MSHLLCWFFAIAAVAAPLPAAAQAFPARPITLTVGYGAGDNMDLMARQLARSAEKALGQPIVVINKPGAAGAVALQQLAKEKPDGHQIVAVIDTPLDRMPSLRKVGYKMDDFVPILQFAAGATGVVVRSGSPWKTLSELIQFAKENPAKVTYATTGAGTSMHVAFEYIARQAALDWTHVPYPGAKQGLAALLGGHISAAVGSTQWVPEVKEGTLRLLAITSGSRMKAFPDVPTIRELGYDFSTDSISVLVAPRGTPAGIVSKLHDAFRQAMDDPEYVRLLQTLELDSAYRNGDQLQRYMEGVAKDFGKAVVDLRIPTEFDGK